MKDLSLIPIGNYCYSIKEITNEGRIKINLCPYWDILDWLPTQLNGYCHLLNESDFIHGGLLWDQVKECDFWIDHLDYYEEENDNT